MKMRFKLNLFYLGRQILSRIGFDDDIAILTSMEGCHKLTHGKAKFQIIGKNDWPFFLR